MRTIVVVTRCLKKEKNITKEEVFQWVFHFKGVYKGERIHSISAEITNGTDFQIGEDYLIYLSQPKINNGKLHGRVVYYKKLEDLSLHF